MKGGRYGREMGQSRAAIISMAIYQLVEDQAVNFALMMQVT